MPRRCIIQTTHSFCCKSQLRSTALRSTTSTTSCKGAISARLGHIPFHTEYSSVAQLLMPGLALRRASSSVNRVWISYHCPGKASCFHRGWGTNSRSTSIKKGPTTPFAFFSGELHDDHWDQSVCPLQGFSLLFTYSSPIEILFRLSDFIFTPWKRSSWDPYHAGQ